MKIKVKGGYLDINYIEEDVSDFKNQLLIDCLEDFLLNNQLFGKELDSNIYDLFSKYSGVKLSSKKITMIITEYAKSKNFILQKFNRNGKRFLIISMYASNNL